MKIIDYEGYEIRAKRPLKNLAGCGIREVGIKASIKILCFVFKVKILKIKCNENGETPLHYFENASLEFDNGTSCGVNIYSIAFILNRLNNKLVN